MDYRRMNGVCCVRIDKGEEIISGLLEVCRKKISGPPSSPG